MKASKTIILSLMFIFLTSCDSGNNKVSEPAFTLETGIKVVEEAQQCNATKEMEKPVLSKLDKQTYLLSIEGYFSCDGKEQAYMTLGREKHSTLVLYNNNGYSCECLKKLNVSIASRRVEPKNILYVVYNSEALTHLEVP